MLYSCTHMATVGVKELSLLSRSSSRWRLALVMIRSSGAARACDRHRVERSIAAQCFINRAINMRHRRLRGIAWTHSTSFLCLFVCLITVGRFHHAVLFGPHCICMAVLQLTAVQYTKGIRGAQRTGYRNVLRTLNVIK